MEDKTDWRMWTYRPDTYIKLNKDIKKINTENRQGSVNIHLASLNLENFLPR